MSVSGSVNHGQTGFNMYIAAVGCIQMHIATLTPYRTLLFIHYGIVGLLIYWFSCGKEIKMYWQDANSYLFCITLQMWNMLVAIIQ